MKAPASTLLGFDHGGRRIGAAVGQSLTGTASPLTVIPVRDNRPDWNVIQRLVDEWQPDALVVGLPLNMDGTEQASTDAARRFGRQLHGRFGLPVHWVDERLSTHEARTRLAEAGDHDAEDDPVAAQIILETWFAGEECRQ